MLNSRTATLKCLIQHNSTSFSHRKMENYKEQQSIKPQGQKMMQRNLSYLPQEKGQNIMRHDRSLYSGRKRSLIRKGQVTIGNVNITGFSN